jgi:hypothetical protein
LTGAEADFVIATLKNAYEKVMSGK